MKEYLKFEKNEEQNGIMKNYQWQKGQCDERLSDAIDAVIETVEKMHSLPQTLQKIQKARNVISSNEKKKMWDVLQEFYAEYKSFINGLSPIFNYYVYEVDAEFYKKLTIDEIQWQLHIVSGYICLHDALVSKVKETFMKTYINSLKNKGFDDSFIRYLKSQL